MYIGRDRRKRPTAARRAGAAAANAVPDRRAMKSKARTAKKGVHPAGRAMDEAQRMADEIVAIRTRADGRLQSG